jgi:predicted DCC family thiol-disulfide oxidoreductase YuxK
VPARHLVLWDGECGFCRRCARWLGERDRDGLFEILPYQELPSPPMTPELEAACARAVHVITSDGTRLRAGRALLFAAEALGWRRTSRLLGLPPLVWLVELGYCLVARSRPLISRVLPREQR